MKRLDGNFRADSKIGRHFEEIVNLYNNGYSTQRLGLLFKIDPSNIYRNLISRGIVIRNHKDASKISFDKGISKRGRGTKSPSWKGGRHKHSEGYILVSSPGHPRADYRGYIYEHILVAEITIGRPIEKHEVVHHVNRIKSDNRPGNLQVMLRTEHQKMHGLEGAHAKWKNKSLKGDVKND